MVTYPSLLKILKANHSRRAIEWVSSNAARTSAKAQTREGNCGPGDFSQRRNKSRFGLQGGFVPYINTTWVLLSQSSLRLTEILMRPRATYRMVTANLQWQSCEHQDDTVGLLASRGNLILFCVDPFTWETDVRLFGLRESFDLSDDQQWL